MTRNEQICHMYVADKRSLAEVGAKFGITRERVRQILNAAGISARHYNNHRREERLLAIRDAHGRVVAGLSSINSEAEIFGVTPASLRGAMWRDGLHFYRKEAQHGTRHYYKHYKCRCEKCVEANRAYSLSLRGKEPPNHGTPSGYTNYGCRCLPCRRAGAEQRREYKRQRLEKEI